MNSEYEGSEEFWLDITSRYDVGEWFSEEDCKLVAKELYPEKSGHPAHVRFAMHQGECLLQCRGWMIDAPLGLMRRDWDEGSIANGVGTVTLWDAYKVDREREVISTKTGLGYAPRGSDDWLKVVTAPKSWLGGVTS